MDSTKPAIERSRSSPSIKIHDGGSSTPSSGSINVQASSNLDLNLENTGKERERDRAKGEVKTNEGSSTLSKRMSLRRAISATASRVSGMWHYKHTGSNFLGTPPLIQRSHSESQLEAGGVSMSREASVGVGIENGGGEDGVGGSGGGVGNGKGSVKGKEREHSDTLDVAGPRFKGRDEGGRKVEGVRYAGEVSVYDNGLVSVFILIWIVSGVLSTNAICDMVTLLVLIFRTQ